MRGQDFLDLRDKAYLPIIYAQQFSLAGIDRLNLAPAK
jgi:hypothetical protein